MAKIDSSFLYESSETNLWSEGSFENSSSAVDDLVEYSKTENSEKGHWDMLSIFDPEDKNLNEPFAIFQSTKSSMTWNWGNKPKKLKEDWQLIHNRPKN